MKKIILLLFVICFLGLRAQKGEIIYKTTMLTSGAKDPTTDYAKKIEKEVNIMTYSLKYDNKYSFFKTIKYVPYDNFMSKIAQIYTHSIMGWYQDATEKKSFYNKKILKTNYMVNHNKMDNWVMSGDTKKIEGYICYKASRTTLNEKTGNPELTEAWYTLDIPLPYGPAGCGGLPGLILELRNKRVVYSVSKLKLNSEKNKYKYPAPSLENPISIKEKIILSRKARKVTDD
ncbi:MAG: GLPGLI family protein [Cellulophaga sp.]|uniref:GLPGLI family protein n=1 Tax=unclassified Cellulophaga TaxID=2634405 RepID=UPI0026E3524C|nr:MULTISPECIES: GLPGLI family protein [unclassified Cellulophaga]MDO6491191.1 GLPGLI family protein [Cellulophaga sp. 2_MG-2023]MDO6495276.1 GLPGLI family protein [Cellulophaga sp. 3_MG-2023]